MWSWGPGVSAEVERHVVALGRDSDRHGVDGGLFGGAVASAGDEHLAGGGVFLAHC